MATELVNTTTNVSSIVPEMWSAKFQEVLLAKLPFLESIDSEYEGEIQALGNTVHINTPVEFDIAADLAEDAAGDTDEISFGGVQLVINKRAYKDFIVSNTALLQSLSFTDKMRDLAVYAIMKKMHADIVADIVPSVTPDHTIAFDSGTTLALADILEAKELLDNSDVPEENRFMTNGVAQANDLFNITGFTSRDFIPAGSPLSTGSIGAPILGFTPKVSSQLVNVSYFYHPTFMTMAKQKGLNVKEYDLGVKGVRASRVNTDILWGLKQLDGKRVVKIG